MNFVTPRGQLRWVFIDQPGRPDLNGTMKFSASLYLKTGSKEEKLLTKQIEDFWKENKPKSKPRPKSTGSKIELDKKGKPTGWTTFNFWTGVAFPSGDEKKVKVYNAKGVEVNLNGRKISNESEGYISGAMGLYSRPESAGVTLYLNAIQLTKFVEYDGGVVLAEADEDGWTGDDLNEAGFEPASDEDLDY